MENKAIQNYLIDSYNKLAYTHNYIFGFTNGGMIYAARVMHGDKILPFITTLDKASKKNGGTIQLKYCQNKERIGVICSHSVEVKPICSVDYLEQLFHADGNKKNRGYLFEVLVADAFGYELNEIPNAKFTTAGDVIDTVNNIHYQVKYKKATFTDEKTVHNLTKAQGE